MSAHRPGINFPDGIFSGLIESLGCYQILVVEPARRGMAPRRPDFLNGVNIMGDLLKRDEHGRLTGPPDPRELARDVAAADQVRRKAIDRVRAQHGMPPLPRKNEK